jgi:hypothetical protein
MALPDFLVIGAQRSGTTLLHAVLDEHPEIFVPYRRKEVHFFDRHYERGLVWYRDFFPPDAEAARYRAIGEVTPDYLFDPAVPGRISAVLPDCRFILSLRSPVERAFSGYLHHRRSFNERRSFDEFLRCNQETVQRGFYHQQLRRFLAYFPRQSFLTLIYEDWVRDPGPDLERVAAFLGLQVGWREPAMLLRRRVNEGSLPRFPGAFAAARRVGRLLSDCNLDGIVRQAKRLGVPDLFGRQATAPQLSPSLRNRLQALYVEEIEALETLLQRDLSTWRHPAVAPLPAADGVDARR